MKLLMVRHAQSTANLAGRLSTSAPGPGLTPLGQTQADGLVDVVGPDGPTALYVSSLLRTHQTARPLAGHLGLRPVVLDGLREIEAGDLEDRPLDAIGGYVQAVTAWCEGELDVAVPGGPTGRQFLSRFDAAVDTVVAAGHDVAALVAHDVSIRVWLALRAIDIDPVALNTSRPLANAGVVVLSGPHPGWRIEGWRPEVPRSPARP